MKCLLRLALLVPCAWLVQAEEFDFDIAEYEKTAFELGGYVELKSEYLRFDTDSAPYTVKFPAGGEQPDSDVRYRAALELEGMYRFGKSSLSALAHADARDDVFGSESEARFYELYYRYARDTLTLDLGKQALHWGKGYAWSPVGFIERRKDPTDPELSREGFVVAAIDGVRSYSGPLSTLAVTAVVLPVTQDINRDFSPEEDVNLAGKLYALCFNTDIDVLVLAEGSRPGRIGLDFSRNLAPNFELHGEVAWVHDQPRRVLMPDRQLIAETTDTTSYLVGLRFLTDQETTYILEYYRNGVGFTEAEAKRFYSLVDDAVAECDPALLNLASSARDAGYASLNPQRNYLYLRATQKEPFDVLYLALSITSILNLDDQSYALIPELSYTGFKNVELRFRLAYAEGSAHTEFGEKQSDRVEMRLRYFF